MASEFNMGARLSLADDFTNPMRDALRATQEFRRAVEGTESAGDGLQREMREIQREFTAASNDMRIAGGVMDDVAEDMGTLGNKAAHVEREMSQMNAEAAQSANAFAGIKSAVAGAAAALGGYFAIGSMKDFAVGSIEAAAAAQAQTAQFSAVFGDMEGDATKALKGISSETNVLESRLKGTFLQIAAFAKTTGVDTSEALALSSRATLAAADSAAFYDRNLEEVAENLQSFLKGNYENDSALGISATEFTRNAAAMKLYNREFTDLTEAQKQLTLLQMVEDGNKLSGALGQASREGEAYENVLGNLNQTFTDFKAIVGGPILQPAVDGMVMLTEAIQQIDPDTVTAKMEHLKGVAAGIWETLQVLTGNSDTNLTDMWATLGVPTGVAQSIQDIVDLAGPVLSTALYLGAGALDMLNGTLQFLMNNMDTLLPIITAAVAGFASFKVLTGIATAFSAVRKSMMLYQAAMVTSTLVTKGFTAAIRANPIGAMVTAIMLLVAAGVWLYQNWDTVSAKAAEFWAYLQFLWAMGVDLVSTVLNNFVTWMRESWDTLWAWLNEMTQAGLDWLYEKFMTGWDAMIYPIEIVIAYIQLAISNFWDVLVGIFDVMMLLLEGNWSGAWERIKGIGEDIMNNVLAFFEAIDLYDIGKDIIDGLIKGIGDMAGAAIETAKSVASGVADAVTGFFDIHSPSRLMRFDVGRQIGAGWELGMLDTAPALEQAALDMANLSYDAFTAPTMDALSVDVPTFDALQVEMPVMPEFALGNDTTARGFSDETVTPYLQGVEIPVGAMQQQAQAEGLTINIEQLVGSLEIVAQDGEDAESLADRVISILYTKLQEAKEIATLGRGALLNG